MKDIFRTGRICFLSVTRLCAHPAEMVTSATTEPSGREEKGGGSWSGHRLCLETSVLRPVGLYLRDWTLKSVTGKSALILHLSD